MPRSAARSASGRALTFASITRREWSRRSMPRPSSGFMRPPSPGRQKLLSNIVSLRQSPSDEHRWVQLAQSVARSLPTAAPARHLFIDVTVLATGGLRQSHRKEARRQIGVLATLPATGMRVEPIALARRASSFKYARTYICELLGLSDRLLSDGPVEYAQGDVYLNPFPSAESQADLFLRDFRRSGGLAYVLLADALDSNSWAAARGHRAGLSRILHHLSDCDGVLCSSREAAMALVDLLDAQQPPLAVPLRIGFLDEPAEVRDATLRPGDGVGHRGGSVAWSRCIEMLCDAGHRNWLCRWHARDRCSVAASPAIVRVA